MKYLIFGEDTYRSYAKLSVMKQEFVKIHGKDNLVIKSGNELKNANIENILFSQTLLGGDRLVIFENIFSECNDDTRKHLIKILGSELPTDLTIVFYESSKIDKRLALFKLLNQPTTAQEFNPLSSANLVHEVKKMMDEKKVALTEPQLRNLIERASDLWQIHNELDKISAFSMGAVIEDGQFQYLVSGSADADTFALLDAISMSDAKTANRILNRALMQGENEVRMLGSIAYQLRNLIRIKDMSESGTNPNSIAKQAGIHPFVVQKTLSQVRKINRAKIVSAYQKLVRADWQIKTGAHKAPDALDLLVVELAT